MFLEILQNSQESTCARVSVLITLHLRIPFLQNTSGRLLLNEFNCNYQNATDILVRGIIYLPHVLLMLDDRLNEQRKVKFKTLRLISLDEWDQRKKTQLFHFGIQKTNLVKKIKQRNYAWRRNHLVNLSRGWVHPITQHACRAITKVLVKSL